MMRAGFLILLSEFRSIIQVSIDFQKSKLTIISTFDIAMLNVPVHLNFSPAGLELDATRNSNSFLNPLSKGESQSFIVKWIMTKDAFKAPSK